MRRMNKRNQTLQEALVDLYIAIKPRKEINDNDNDNGNDEYERLSKIEPVTIIEYIRSSFDIIVQMLIDERINEYNKANDDPQAYENLLIKLEGDIRGHIRIEHQLKLHNEKLQSELEIMEREIEQLKSKNKQHKHNYNHSKNNIDTSTSNVIYSNMPNDDSNTEINNIKMLLKSYEDQTLKLASNEKRLKFQLVQREKDMKQMSDNFQIQIKALNRKIALMKEKMHQSNTIKLSSCRDDSLNNKNTSTTRKTTSATKKYPSNTQTELTKKSTFQTLYPKDRVLMQKEDKRIGKKNHSLSFVLKNAEELTPLSNKNHEELLAKLDKYSKKIIKESNTQQGVKKKKGHNRYKSMQESVYLQSQKEKLFNSNMTLHNQHNQTHHHHQHKDSINSQSKVGGSKSGSKKKKTFIAVPTNNFVINQIDAPFVNNINIYTSNSHANNTNTNSHNHNSNSNLINNTNGNTQNQHHSNHNSSCVNTIYHKLNPDKGKRIQKAKQVTPLRQHNN